MTMPLSLNIVCLDVPYPANYGGAINMFHKIRWLHQKGVIIYLHCFVYNDRKETDELKKYCHKVYYYQRKTGLSSFFSFLPYNVKSRISAELKANLLKNEFPVLFEALHSCYLLADPDFKSRQTIFRESNIEHDYFLHLFQNEINVFKKIYFFLEARKLKRFEKVVALADLMLIVSTEDEQYFKTKYPGPKISYLPSFHQNDAIEISEGASDYILYHGNLGVSENYRAADWLIEHVFSQLTYRVIIAGLNPPPFLKEKIASYPHIQLKENCTAEEMNTLIADAHIHCLYTMQATGLKLKLLNVLFRGRFVIANQHMTYGTHLKGACRMANTPSEYLEAIRQCFQLAFHTSDREQRATYLQAYRNEVNVAHLLSDINQLQTS